MTLMERIAFQIKHNNPSALQMKQPEKDAVPLATPFTASVAVGILHAAQRWIACGFFRGMML